jgi:hypothetical protein
MDKIISKIKEANAIPGSGTGPRITIKTKHYEPGSFKTNSGKRGRNYGKTGAVNDGDDDDDDDDDNDDEVMRVLKNVKIKKAQLKFMEDDTTVRNSASDFAKSIASSVIDKKVEYKDIYKYLMEKVKEEINKIEGLQVKSGRKK